MTIGELARAAGVNVETVRYYERRGLLVPPERAGGGYRRYGEDALWRLQFVARAKQLGFTLAEIAELLAASGAGCVDDVRDAANAKLADLDARVQALYAQQARLRRLVETCENGDGGDCVSLTVVDDA
jgi:DNA-binding transcriptional MerR regulator